MTIFYDPRCLEYSSLGHPERPERIARIAPLIKQRHPDWEWRVPQAVSTNKMLRAPFGPQMQQGTRTGADFDINTPPYPNSATYAARSDSGQIIADRAGTCGAS